MDRRLTAYVLRYLLEHRFESKAEMARRLGMRQRTIEKVFENLDVAKAGTVAFDMLQWNSWAASNGKYSGIIIRKLCLSLRKRIRMSGRFGACL